ncbi:MAG: thioredoxin-like domain-containing protein, partial [Proteobacteria bacterium]|nr:thioredoxin-like domain-containing protein [Pseudomonadota bacterium]
CHNTNFKDFFKDQHSKMKILYFFASWCRSCKQGFSEAISMIESGILKKKAVHLMLISLDQNEKQLQDFLLPFHHIDFNICSTYKMNKADLSAILSSPAMQYKNSIPHVVLMQGSNIIASGSYNMSKIKDFVNSNL